MKSRYFVALAGDIPLGVGLSPHAALRNGASRLGGLLNHGFVSVQDNPLFRQKADGSVEVALPVFVVACSREDYAAELRRSPLALLGDLVAEQLAGEPEDPDEPSGASQAAKGAPPGSVLH